MSDWADCWVARHGFGGPQIEKRLHRCGPIAKLPVDLQRLLIRAQSGRKVALPIGDPP